MSNKLDLRKGEKLHALGEQRFLLERAPLSKKQIARLRYGHSALFDDLLSVLQKPLLIEGEFIHEWVYLYGEMLPWQSRDEFVELCRFVGVDCRTFGECGKKFNIWPVED